MEARAPFTPTEAAGVPRCDLRVVFPQNAPSVYPSSQTVNMIQTQQHEQGAKEPPVSAGLQCATQSVNPPPPILPAPSFISSINPAIKRRRKNSVLTPGQLGMLEMTFASCQYPSSVLRRQVAYACMLQDKTVQTWFQNRRSRNRRRLNKIKPGNAKQPLSVKPSPEDTPPKDSEPVADQQGCSQKVPQQAEWSTGTRSVMSFSVPALQAMWLESMTPDVYPISIATHQDRTRLQELSTYNQLVTDATQPEIQVVYPSLRGTSEQALGQQASIQNFRILPEERSQQADRMSRPLSRQAVSSGYPHLEDRQQQQEQQQPEQQQQKQQHQHFAGFSHIGSWDQTLPKMHQHSGHSQSYLPQTVTPTRDIAANQTAAPASQHNYKYFSPFYPRASATNWETNYPDSFQTSLASSQEQQMFTFPTAHLQMSEAEVTPLHYQISQSGDPELTAYMLRNHSAASEYKYNTLLQQQHQANIANAANIESYNSVLDTGFTAAYSQPKSSLYYGQASIPQSYQGHLMSTSFQPGYTNTDFTSPELIAESMTSQLYPQQITEPTTCEGFANQYRYVSPQVYHNSTLHSLPAYNHPVTSLDAQYATQDNLALPGDHLSPETPAQPDVAALPTIPPQIPHQFSVGHALISNDTTLSSNSVSLIGEPPSPSMSVSSLGSVNTLYIDLDAHVD